MKELKEFEHRISNALERLRDVLSQKIQKDALSSENTDKAAEIISLKALIETMAAEHAAALEHLQNQIKALLSQFADEQQARETLQKTRKADLEELDAIIARLEEQNKVD